MTAPQLLRTCRQAGVVLSVDGDGLDVDAPAGVLTPELRDELARRKADLLALLAPVTEFVSLRGGLTVPVPAFRLALDLEQRGFRMARDQDNQFTIEPMAALTETDLAGIAQWRHHLATIIAYEVPNLT